MWLISKIAEARIMEAMKRGEFNDLPGAGKPLVLGDDAMVPEDLRAAYRMLKNAGYVPPEAAIRGEIADVQALIIRADDAKARTHAHRRLTYLMAQLQAMRGVSCDLRVEQVYYEKLLERLNTQDSG